MSQIEVTIIFSFLSAHSYQLNLPYCTHSTPTGYLTTMRKQNQRISKDFSADFPSWPHNSVCGRGRNICCRKLAVFSLINQFWLFFSLRPILLHYGQVPRLHGLWFSIVSNVLFPHNYHEEEKEGERGKEREGQPYTSLTTKRKATFLFFSGHSFHTTVTAKSFVTNSKMF